VLAWVAARRHTGATRLTWKLAALGLACSAIGDITWAAYEWLGDAPGASAADVGWLSSYALLGVAIIRLSGSSGDRRRGDTDALIDALAVGIVALVVVWYASLEAIVDDTSTSALVRIVWAAYPVADAVVLTLAVRFFLTTGRSRAGLLFTAGLSCWLLADLAYVVWADTGSLGVLLDAAWMVGPVLIGAAAWWPMRTAPTPSSAASTMGSWRLILVTTPILLPNVVEIWGFARQLDPNPFPMFVATIVLASLVYVRAWRLLRANARARSALRSSQRHFAALAASSADASVVVDDDGRLLTDEPATGRPDQSLLLAVGTKGSMLGDLLGMSDVGQLQRLLADARRTPGVTATQELTCTDHRGRPRWVQARATDLIADPDVAGTVVNLHDTTDRKAMEDALAHQALHDALTGLPNRVLLRDRIDHALRRNARTGESIAVVYLDLDGFKRINDSFGHDVGDELLRQVADRLVRSVRPSETVARLGGDEFAILIEDPADRDAIAEITDRVVEGLSVPIDVGDRQIIASASLGVAVSEDDASATSLLRDADVAMYQAKATGGNLSVRYRPEMGALIQEQLQLETDLVRAIDEHEFELLYQPVVKLDATTVVGFEALLRWHHPTLGMLPPDRFIPITERTGLIVPIGRWVLETACLALARLHETHEHLTMAVNVSGRQLAADSLVDDVVAALRRSGVAPERVVLEMTETVLVEDVAGVTGRLHELRELGVRLAIDDFGTGYSSLGYLRQFPVDILKIDRSFVNTIVDEGTIPPIVRGLLDLADTLGLETVAEGIELTAQHTRLRDSSCEMGQGFLFARPMRIDDVTHVLASSAASPQASPPASGEDAARSERERERTGRFR